jgi:hypothetical protein
MDQATVFVDTCVFLEFRPFSQLPWRKIVPAKKVKLAVCLPVVNELDEKKTYNPRLSERARRSYKEIEEKEGKEFQDGVTPEIDHYSLRRDSYPETMNPDHRDDQIIRCAQLYLERHPDAAPVMVATDDGSMRVRCRLFSIPAVGIPEEERLPVPQDDFLKKVRKLEGELAAERGRRPELTILVTPAGGNPEADSGSALQLSKKFRVVDVNEAIKEIREDHPKLGVRSTYILGEKRAAEYNGELEDFFTRYGEYFGRLNRWVEARGRFYDCDLYVKNEGRALATHIQLELVFPPFVRLLDPLTAWGEHDPAPRPPYPERPEQRLSRILSPLGSLPLLVKPVAEQLADEPYIPKVHFDDDEGPRLSCSLGKLLHGGAPVRLEKLTFWFLKGEQPKTFGAQYRIRAAELPEEEEGQTLFKVDTGAQG